MKLNTCRTLNLPLFQRNDAENAPDAFSPEVLLGGVLLGAENRLAELATRFVCDGAPIFDRPVGSVESGAPRRATSRADVEYLLSRFGSSDEDVSPDAIDLLYDRTNYNRIAAKNNAPQIVDYQRFEDVPFLSPLVFYGPSGSGKTRLVEGICQTRRSLEPKRILYYLSATDFSRALVDAIRREQTELFRRLFIQASVVVIEDIDALATRETAQSEFPPLLDALLSARKLVVLTSSQRPNEIPGLLPDLAARLSSGLLIPVNLPSRETRTVAFHRVAEKLGLQLDSKSRDLCLERFPLNLGGFCASLVQFARETATFHTNVSYESALEYVERRNPEREWTLSDVVKAVAKYFSVSIVDMRGKKRYKTLALARKYVAYLARRLTDATLKEIGEQFSARNHSTIIHAIRDVESLLETDEQARRDLAEIVKALNAQRVVEIPQP